MAPNLFSCTHCSYQNQHPCNVKTHIIRHHRIKNPKIHRCPFCHRMYENLFDMKAHMGESFCSNTNKEFAKTLQRKVSQRRYYDCSECTYQSWVPTNVVRHMIDRHNIPYPKVYKCYFCSDLYQNATELNSHMKQCTERDYMEGPPEKNHAGDNFNGKVKRVDRTIVKQVSRKVGHYYGAKQSQKAKKKVYFADQIKVNEDKEVKLYNCLNCSYQSKYANHIRSHMKKLHGVAVPKINKCNFCGEMFENSYVLKRHVDSACGQINNQQNYKAKPVIESQTQIDAFYECPECNFNAGDTYELRRHVKLEHGRNENEANKCNICNESFQFRTELKAHKVKCQQFNGVQRENHRKRRPSVTPEESIVKSEETFVKVNASIMKPQSKTSNNASSPRKKGTGDEVSEGLQNKIKWAVQLTDKNAKEMILLVNCLKCTYQSKYPSHIRSHMKNVHGVANPKINKCEFCGAMFQNSFVLKDHIKTSHCDIVKGRVKRKKKVSRARARVLKRQNRDIPVGLYKCPQCEKSCNTFLELRIHKQSSHFKKSKVEIEMYKCLKCNYKSMYTCSVRAHMKITHQVSNPKIHGCKFCGEMFQNLYQLKSHTKDTYCVNTNKDFAKKLVEAENKKWYYNCSKCNYRTGYSQCIKSHIRVKHNKEDPNFYKCEACREIFVESIELRKHICSFKKTAVTVNHIVKSEEKIILEIADIEANSDDSDIESIEVYKCSFCEDIFEDKVGYDNHFKLPLCPKLRTPSEVQNLDNPLQQSTSDDSHPWSQSDLLEPASSFDKEIIKPEIESLKIKIDPNSYSCSTCQKYFLFSEDLEAHKLEKHVIFKEASKPFSKSYQMHNELLPHTSEDLLDSSDLLGYTGDFDIDRINIPSDPPEDMKPVAPGSEDNLFLQLGDPSASIDDVPQVLQLVTDPANRNGDMENLDMSSFPPDAVFYTYEGDEANLAEYRNEEAIFYTYDCLDDTGFSESLDIPEGESDQLLEEN